MAGYAVINMEAKPLRLLTREQAASYCNLTISKFLFVCPCRPVEITERLQLWDIHDLDVWIDSLKTNDLCDDAVVARLP